MKIKKERKRKEEKGSLTPCIFQFKRSRVKYDPNMSRKQELSTRVAWHKYLWNFMLCNPSCSYIMFLFLKNTEAQQKLCKGSGMKSNLAN